MERGACFKAVYADQAEMPLGGDLIHLSHEFGV
ncbi:MAG: hypothetical protein RIQ49_1239 [Pseudomonadota bacterium]